MQLVNKYYYQAEDLADELYRLSDATYDFGSPWTKRQFKEDIINERSNYLILIEEGIVAYLSYHQVFDEAEIFNIAISKAAQRKGYGSYLIRHLNHILLEEQADQMILEVRRSNKTAQKLYESNGFLYLSRRKKYYPDPVEDALVMVKKVRPEINNERIDFSN